MHSVEHRNYFGAPRCSAFIPYLTGTGACNDSDGQKAVDQISRTCMTAKGNTGVWQLPGQAAIHAELFDPEKKGNETSATIVW